MAVDGEKNTVSEIDVVPHPDPTVENTYGNIFGPTETVLKKEGEELSEKEISKSKKRKLTSGDVTTNSEEEDSKPRAKPMARKRSPRTTTKEGEEEEVVATDDESSGGS